MEKYKLPPIASDLSNKRFGRLIALYPMKKEGKKQPLCWVCKCDCGKETVKRAASLLRNATKSCGCLKKELLIQRNKEHKGIKGYLYKHGLSGTKDYRTNKTLLRRYGITLNQYKEMYNQQNQSCQICGDSYSKLAVDHCHDTKIIRGLLCYKCNNIVASFDVYFQLSKNKQLFNKILNYLKRRNNAFRSLENE